MEKEKGTTKEKRSLYVKKEAWVNIFNWLIQWQR